ncbi:MAG: hypothetical protein E7046_03120 [Lentisphaerae bacterium]|nr:hypothetical protein [Lentisphaerota bacterium]
MGLPMCMKAAVKFFLLLVSLLVTVLLVVRFSEISLPQPALECISRRFSSESWLTRIDSIKWSFPGKIRIEGLRLINRKKAEAEPFLSAESATIRLSLSRFPWKAKNIIKSITVSKLRMPRLSDGYYIPDSIEFPGAYDFRESNEPVELDIPDIAPFRLTLIEPDILNLQASHVMAKSVSARDGILRFNNVTVKFPDRDVDMSVTGYCELNVPEQKVVGSVHGQARQHNIRPMLQALDISNSYQFVDAFTGVRTPVGAGCKFEVNLRNKDLRIFLDLNPTGGAYRKVPLKTVQGNLDIRVFVREHFQNAFISVGPVDARLADGSFITGSVFYENTNDIGYVTFRNVHSTTSLSNALAVADVLNDGTLDCLQPETPPTIRVDGTMAVNPVHAATNRIDGSIAFKRGAFFGIPLANATSEFHVRGESIDFTNARASMPRGGNINGKGMIAFPGFKEENASFKIELKGSDIALADALASLGINSGDMRGKVFGTLEFGGPLTTALVSRTYGKAAISLRNGHLARLNMFAGLTDYLAKNIPGVSSLVDQSNAEVECTITNGVISASKIQVSGDIFSITGSGTYSMPDDKIDIRARVRIFKNDSIIGKIADPITWTFSKLLMEFKVYGSLDDPKWEYISVMERLL